MACDHEPKFLKGMCRKCYDAARYPARRDRMQARAKKYRASLSPEKRQERREYEKNWDKANPNKSRAYQKKYQASLSPEKREKYLTYLKKYLKEYRKATGCDGNYHKTHPDKVREHSRKRRARKAGCAEHFTEAEFETLKRQLGHRCVGCWKTEKQLMALGRKLVPDHIVSLSKGGLDDITNIQPLCHGTGGCNNQKNAKFHDFLVT